MSWRTTAELVRALEKEGDLIRISEPISDRLELAAVQQRMFQKKGPALLFENVVGSRWPALANLYGTPERMEWLLLRGYRGVAALVDGFGDPLSLIGAPRKWPAAVRAAVSALPKIRRGVPAGWEEIDPTTLPGIQSWPEDGGRFWTLPQVYSENPLQPGWRHSNIGMYRIQVDGNDYPNGSVGMHYQLRRGIGSHHQAAQQRGEPLKVSVFLGGHPAHALAAVMPLPDHLPEIAFAGALAGRRFSGYRYNGYLLSGDADFVLVGKVYPNETLPEGPFGDHFGYYSLRHQMPVLQIEKAWARPGAIFPLTVVARPPQEDTLFGDFVHRLTAPAIASQIPGVSAVHAVDDSGVHPLLLALGSERDVPYETLKPRELLTQACAILGFGQLSLAKVLIIADGARGDAPPPAETEQFLRHLLERVDWKNDIRFLTKMPGDTLDYTGGELHGGSKCIWTAAGAARRTLGTELPSDLPLPPPFGPARVALSGVLVVRGPAWGGATAALQMEQLAGSWSGRPLDSWPLVVVVDDEAAAAGSLRDFLWTTFTRIDPASDIYGVDAQVEQKHWSCRGPLLLDARIKSHHAPPVLPDPATEAAIERFFAPSGSLERFR